MARVNNLSDFLADVADAIRTKKETTGQIPAENFDTEIASIETGVDTSDATATSSDIVEGKTAYGPDGKIEGTVKEYTMGTPLPAELSFINNSPTGDGLTFVFRNDGDNLLRPFSSINGNANNTIIAEKGEITPEKIVKGNTIFGVEGTAETGGSEINNQDKEVTTNGTYTADEGYTGLGTVTVNVPQDVKLFKTIEEMQADTTSEKNTQAIVYGDAETILQSGVSYSKLNFPDEVVFDTAQTSSFTIMLGGFFNTIKFSPTACSIGLSVKYTSEDGITYTRTDTKGNPVSMSINLFDTDMDSYGDILSKFIFPVVKSFLGLYTWSGSSWKYSSTQLSDLTEADLLPSKVAYGKNGIVVGSNAIFDNIPVKNKLGMLYGLDNVEIDGANYCSLKDITTDIPVSAPEENVTVHFLKSKTLENGDKLILKPNGTANKQTSFDGLYSLSYNLNSNVLTITNNTTKETYETSSNNSNRVIGAAFYGHIVYCVQSKTTFGSTAEEWNFQINKYDIDTGTWTMGASYSTTGSSSSYSLSFILFTELDTFAICNYYNKYNKIGPKKLILMGKLSDIAQDFWLKYDVVPTDDSRAVYRSSDGTLFVLISNTELREYSPEGNLLHTYTINLPSSLSEYVGSYPYFHPFCQRVSNILYMNKYKINLDTGVCEEVDEIHPTMGNNITSNVSKYSNNMIYLFDSDYNINATHQVHKDLATVANGGLYIYSPNLVIVQNNSDGNVILTDGARKVTGTPYTVSNIFDYDNVIIPCMGYVRDNRLVENYVLIEKGTMNKAQYNTAVATTEDILGNTTE